MRRILATASAGTLVLALATAAIAQRHATSVQAVTAPPLLQSSGGRQPVRLLAADVAVDTSGSLARTTLLLTISNPNDRVLEGTLQFPLQPGQRVAGFALDIGGAMRDAVPVPKEKGRQVFESIERRNVDPALLEQTAGNQFRLRVYPVPAHGTRQVRLVLDETMRREGDAWRMQVPVELLAGADAFALRVRADGVRSAPEVIGAFDALRFVRSGRGYEARTERRNFRPSHGLALRFRTEATPQVYTSLVDNEHYFLAEIPVDAVAPKRRRIPRSVGLLWDASGSARKRDRDGELAVLDAYFRAMGNGRVSLRVLRDVGEGGGNFEVRNGDWSALRATLESLACDGASNLSDWSPQPGIGEYLLVSDGFDNYSTRAFPQLLEGQRLFALDSSEPAADGARLEALALARGGRRIAWHGHEGAVAAGAALVEDGMHVASLHGDGVADLVAESVFIEGGMLRVAGRMTEPAGTLRVMLDAASTPRNIELPLRARAEARMQVGPAWATWRIAQLSAEPERNRAAIARIGQAFSLVTAGTSLLVVEDPADYVRYDIVPPAALRDQVAALRLAMQVETGQSRSARIDAVAEKFAQRVAWWERSFPKSTPPIQKRGAAATLDTVSVASSATPPAPAAMPDSVNPIDVAAAEHTTVLDAEQMQREAPQRARAAAVPLLAPGVVSGAAPVATTPQATIRLQPWQPDSPYARRLRGATADQLYAFYLDERDSRADSTAFYLDVADLLLQRGRRDEALRVLSNLAELELENRHVLRVLGYRLTQAQAHPLAVQVFRQVLGMAEEEPQSHRDLALALAANGERQQAIERMYEVVAREWDSRFAEIELVALNELNQIIATSPTPLDTAFVDRRLLRNLPLDLRVALAWDSDNSDMDLWVTDPNGEKCYYAHPLTYQGGLISDDFTGGYGPEEFVLRDAKPGRYRIEAHYFGDRQQIVTGATTLTLTLSTGWGTTWQEDRKTTLRLSGKDESVLVGEFEVH
jgi:Ca-activated chloride channel homolog